MSKCSEEINKILSATDNFADGDALSSCSDSIRFVCNNLDEEGAALLSERHGALIALKQSRAETRSLADVAPVTEKSSAGRAPMLVLRMLTSLSVAVVALTVGLCIMYATDEDYLLSHSAVAKTGIAAIVIAALFFVIAILSFVIYCRTKYGAGRVEKISVETRIACEVDGNAAFDIMLIDMLLKALAEFYSSDDLGARTDDVSSSDNIGD